MTVPIGFSRLGSTTNRANRSRWNVASPSIVSDPEAVGRWWHGVKIIGTDVPGLLRPGRSTTANWFLGRVASVASHHCVASTRALQKADRGSGRSDGHGHQVPASDYDEQDV